MKAGMARAMMATGGHSSAAPEAPTGANGLGRPGHAASGGGTEEGGTMATVTVDIDPTVQDWPEAGHYDYDAVAARLSDAVRRQWPGATITRERRQHANGEVGGPAMLLLVSGGDDMVEEALRRIEDETPLHDLPWIADEA